MGKLLAWKDSEFRKPLVLRGARQVGKTTLVKIFGESFDTFVLLNLELEEDRRIFDNTQSFETVVQRIFLEKKHIK